MDKWYKIGSALMTENEIKSAFFISTGKSADAPFQLCDILHERSFPFVIPLPRTRRESRRGPSRAIIAEGRGQGRPFWFKALRGTLELAVMHAIHAQTP